jgi:hypothetical protein
VPLLNDYLPSPEVDVNAGAGAAGAAHPDETRPSKRRLEQLAALWARQTGRTIVVA